MPRYAQHFLINRHAIERIVAALHLLPTDHVIEIGPGKGALTQHLLKQCEKLIVVEVDPVWVERLTKNFGQNLHVDIRHQDILKFDFHQLPPRKEGYVIVGNLPYNLTSPILRKICDWEGWSKASVMVQKEVGYRMAAAAGSPDYGALSVGLQLTCEVKKEFDLSQRSFDPPPKVESSVVQLIRRTQPLSNDIASVQKIVQAAFQQRRKTIMNSLSHGLKIDKEKTKSILKMADLDENERPERISIDKFIKLSQLL